MSVLFISHSNRDAGDAARLREGLLAHGFSNVFVDNHSISPGQDWEQVLYENLRSSLAVIALVTTDFNKSRWCFAELTHARALRCPILPIVIDDAPLPDLLRHIQAVTLTNRAEIVDQVRDALKDLKIDAADITLRDARRSPYPGMSAFDLADAAVYVGREQDLRKVLVELHDLSAFSRAPRSLLVMGASGTGKSSLLHAGVLPKLAADPARWLTLGPLRPAQQPFDRLHASLQSAAAASPDAVDGLASRLRSAAALPYLLRPIVGSRTAVIAVDQLEELTNSTDDEIRALQQWLKAAAQIEEPRVVILGTIRTDRVDALRFVAPWSERAHVVPLARLEEPELLRTITEPARMAGVRFEPDLAQEILADVRGRQALPLLAFTLRELWHRRPKGSSLSRAAYTEDLRIDNAVRRAAEHAAGPLLENAPERDALRRALLELVEILPDGTKTRRRARRSRLPPAADPAIAQLIEARLLVVDGEFVEPAHEALFEAWEQLAEWVNDARRALMVRAEADIDADRWKNGGQGIDTCGPRNGSSVPSRFSRFQALRSSRLPKRSSPRPNKPQHSETRRRSRSSSASSGGFDVWRSRRGSSRSYS